MILTDEKLLRSPCDEVSLEEALPIIEQLEQELNRVNTLGASGIGLAAPQIGIFKKVSIIRLPDYKINLVNAKINKLYDEQVFKMESCLSFSDPADARDTKRFMEAHIINNLVYPHAFIATNFLSIVCQHEIDHYNSTLFFDHAIPIIDPKIKELRKKLGPNDPCFCGSNKKLKKCHGR